MGRRVAGGRFSIQRLGTSRSTCWCAAAEGFCPSGHTTNSVIAVVEYDGNSGRAALVPACRRSAVRRRRVLPYEKPDSYPPRDLGGAGRLRVVVQVPVGKAAGDRRPVDF